MPAECPTGVVTLVFTDIEGSSELWEQHGPRFKTALDQHHAVMRQAAARWNGFEVKTEGDSFFLAFSRASNAVCFAAEAQLALSEVDWPAVLPGLLKLRVRMGAHTGEPLLAEDTGGRPDYLGPAVGRAARIGNAAHGGQILCSDATRSLADGELPPEIRFADLGLHRLKGVGQDRLWQVLHPQLPHEFLAPHTLNSRRHNLPLAPTPLIGREQEVTAWGGLLRRRGVRMVTVVSFGGMGKSRTALQVGELAADDFRDGVWWVALDQARSGTEMVQRICSSLRMDLQPIPTAEEQLLNFLQDRELLLILDNTEQIPEAATVAQRLVETAPDLKLLVTTRRSLDLPAEHVVELGPLPLPDARELFVERARSRHAAFAETPTNAADITALCERLERIPLALELAASRVVAMSPRDIYTRLTERFRLLQIRAPGVPERQRALRGTIDWSFSLLPEEEQHTLAQLSVFAREFTLTDAEVVSDAFDALESVTELRRHSLLAAGTDPLTQEMRFHMLEAVREYAGEKLDERPELQTATRRRHAEHLLGCSRRWVADLRTPAERDSFSRMDRYLPDLHLALDWSAANGQLGWAAELALSLGTFLERRGLHRESWTTIRRGLAAAESLPNPSEVTASLWREMAGLHLARHEWEEAETAGGRALVLFEQLGEGRGAADARNVLGLTAKNRAEFAAAREHFTAALDAYQQTGDRIGTAIVLNNLGLTELQDPEGDRAAAAGHWQEALRLYRELGDQRGNAETLTNVGVLAQLDGRLEEAWRYYDAALALEQELQHPFGIGRALCNLGEVAEARGEQRSAYRLLTAATAVLERIGSPAADYSRPLAERLAAQHKPAALGDDGMSLQEMPLGELVVWARS